MINVSKTSCRKCYCYDGPLDYGAPRKPLSNLVMHNKQTLAVAKFASFARHLLRSFMAGKPMFDHPRHFQV